MIESIILVLVAVIPIFLIGFYIYNKDKEKEPLMLLFQLLIAGIIAALTVIFLNKFFKSFIPLFSKNTFYMSTFEILIYSFVCIALVEEGCKFAFLYLITYYHKEFDYSFDMIVYGVFTSLGFALFENIMFVFSGGIETGLLRAITAIPLHACTGAFMGIFLSIAKQRELLNFKDFFKYKVIALLVPTILHGMYDFCAFATNQLMLIMTVVIMFTTVTIINVNVHNKLDRKIKNNHYLI